MHTSSCTQSLVHFNSSLTRFYDSHWPWSLFSVAVMWCNSMTSNISEKLRERGDTMYYMVRLLHFYKNDIIVKQCQYTEVINTRLIYVLCNVASRKGSILCHSGPWSAPIWLIHSEKYLAEYVRWCLLLFIY